MTVVHHIVVFFMFLCSVVDSASTFRNSVLKVNHMVKVTDRAKKKILCVCVGVCLCQWAESLRLLEVLTTPLFELRMQDNESFVNYKYYINLRVHK